MFTNSIMVIISKHYIYIPCELITQKKFMLCGVNYLQYFELNF